MTCLLARVDHHVLCILFLKLIIYFMHFSQNLLQWKKKFFNISKFREKKLLQNICFKNRITLSAMNHA